MFGKRCTLCGGKLDSRNICTECGLNNSKSDKTYKLNKSECDHEPLTHVHEEKKESQLSQPHTYPSQPQSSQSQQYRPQADRPQSDRSRSYKQKPQQPRGVKMVTRLIAILTVAGIIGGIILGVTDHTEESSTVDVNTGHGETYDPYEWTERIIDTAGENVEYNLDSGNYIVGVHIPEGYYKAFPEDDFDTVRVDDPDNGIYLYEYKQKEGNYLADLRLFNGAVVSIYSRSTLKLTSDNAQQLTGEGSANPVTQEVHVMNGNTLKSGIDFEPGIYDIEVVKGYGNVECGIYDEDGNQMSIDSKVLGEDSTDGNGFRYMVLPKDATVKCDSGMEVVLKPSETIASTDYTGFYMNY